MILMLRSLAGCAAKRMRSLLAHTLDYKVYDHDSRVPVNTGGEQVSALELRRVVWVQGFRGNVLDIFE
jgi:hypothetical protein